MLFRSEHKNVALSGLGKAKPYIHGETENAIATLSFDYDNFESAQEIDEITSDYEILSEEELERRKKTDFQDTWFVYVYWRMLGLISQEEAFAYNLEKNS